MFGNFFYPLMQSPFDPHHSSISSVVNFKNSAFISGHAVTYFPPQLRWIEFSHDVYPGPTVRRRLQSSGRNHSKLELIEALKTTGARRNVLFELIVGARDSASNASRGPCVNLDSFTPPPFPHHMTSPTAGFTALIDDGKNTLLCLKGWARGGEEAGSKERRGRSSGGPRYRVSHL